MLELESKYLLVVSIILFSKFLKKKFKWIKIIIERNIQQNTFRISVNLFPNQFYRTTYSMLYIWYIYIINNIVDNNVSL